MLVLGRKSGEYVMIGDDIMIMVVKNNDRELRLAIDAPKYVNIIRGELYEERFKYPPSKEVTNPFDYIKS